MVPENARGERPWLLAKRPKVVPILKLLDRLWSCHRGARPICEEWRNERLQVRTVKQITRNAGRLCRIKIALFVSHHKALANIHRIPLEQRFDHARLRLAACASDRIACNEAIRMMWAKFERIDMGADMGEITRHPVVQSANMMLLVKPSSDPRLVRHNKREITCVIHGFYGPSSSLHPPNCVRIKDVAIVLIENTVTIKEYCRAHEI